MAEIIEAISLVLCESEIHFYLGRSPEGYAQQVKGTLRQTAVGS